MLITINTYLLEWDALSPDLGIYTYYLAASHMSSVEWEWQMYLFYRLLIIY